MLQDDDPALDPAGEEGSVERDHRGGELVPAGDELDDDALVSVRVVLQPGRVRVVAPEHTDALSRSERAADVQRLGLADRVQPVLVDAGPRLLLAAPCSCDVVAWLTQDVDLELSNARCNPFGDSGRAAPPLDPSILADRERSIYPPIGVTWPGG